MYLIVRCRISKNQFRVLHSRIRSSTALCWSEPPPSLPFQEYRRWYHVWFCFRSNISRNFYQTNFGASKNAPRQNYFWPWKDFSWGSKIQKRFSKKSLINLQNAKFDRSVGGPVLILDRHPGTSSNQEMVVNLFTSVHSHTIGKLISLEKVDHYIYFSKVSVLNYSPTTINMEKMIWQQP